MGTPEKTEMESHKCKSAPSKSPGLNHSPEYSPVDKQLTKLVVAFIGSNGEGCVSG